MSNVISLSQHRDAAIDRNETRVAEATDAVVRASRDLRAALAEALALGTEGAPQLLILAADLADAVARFETTTQ
jgi:hypothetical protein